MNVFRRRSCWPPTVRRMPLRATEAATDLASKSGAELHVVHVWHDVRGFPHGFVKRELKRQGQEVLDEQVGR